MRKPKSVRIDGAWVGIGGNTPFEGFYDARIVDIRVDDEPMQPAALITIQFTNGSELSVRTTEYMAKY